MNVNDLPELCLQTIFDRLPLPDLSTIRLVCWRWNTLQRVALRRRRSLTLLIGNEATLSSITSQCSMEVPFINDFIDFASDHFSSTTQHGTEHIQLRELTSVEAIQEHLPNLASLSIVFSHFSCEMIDNVTRLLEHFSSQLERVQLWYWAADVNDRKDRTDLQRCLSRQIQWLAHSLPLLKHLTLYFHDYENIYTSLPIAEKLQEFYYSQENCSQTLAQWIEANGSENYQLQRVGIANCLAEKLLSGLMHNRPMTPILQSIEYLKVDYDQEHMQRYDDLFAMLTSLKVLDLQVQHIESGFSMFELARSLRHLKQLHHLRLNIKYFHFGLLLERDENRLTSEIGQLPSVQVLTLDVCTLTHLDGHSKHWASLLPNLSLIRIQHYFSLCDHCGWDNPEIEPPEEVQRRCTRQLMATFQHCRRECLLYNVNYFKGRLQCQLTVADLQADEAS